MTYSVQAQLAVDVDVHRRVAACAASEGVAAPEGWVWDRRWVLSTQPGWVAAYLSAIASGTDRPGAAEDVITDGMILAAVQTILAAEPTETPPDPAE